MSTVYHGADHRPNFPYGHKVGLMTPATLQRLVKHTQQLRVLQLIDFALFLIGMLLCIILIARSHHGDLALYDLSFWCSVVLVVLIGISWLLRWNTLRTHTQIREWYATRIAAHIATNTSTRPNTITRMLLFYQAILMRSAAPHIYLVRSQLTWSGLCAGGLLLVPKVLSYAQTDNLVSHHNSVGVVLAYLCVPVLMLIPLWFGTCSVSAMHVESWRYTLDDELQYCTPKGIVEHTQLGHHRAQLCVTFYECGAFSIENAISDELSTPKKRRDHLRIVQ